jgi:hypothetical protein
MHAHRLRATLLCLLASVAMVGCGIGGGGSGSGDEDQIRTTIETAFTKSDPALCAQVLSESFISAFYGTLARCRQSAASGQNADRVSVSAISVDGDHATALTRASGGSASPKPVTLKLIKQSGAWKIDGVTGRLPSRQRSG